MNDCSDFLIELEGLFFSKLGVSKRFYREDLSDYKLTGIYIDIEYILKRFNEFSNEKFKEKNKDYIKRLERNLEEKNELEHDFYRDLSNLKNKYPISKESPCCLKLELLFKIRDFLISNEIIKILKIEIKEIEDEKLCIFEYRNGRKECINWRNNSYSDSKYSKLDRNGFDKALGRKKVEIKAEIKKRDIAINDIEKIKLDIEIIENDIDKNRIEREQVKAQKLKEEKEQKELIEEEKKRARQKEKAERETKERLDLAKIKADEKERLERLKLEEQKLVVEEERQKRQEEIDERQRIRDFEIKKLELELQIRETDLLREREEREMNQANIDSLRDTLKDS